MINLKKKIIFLVLLILFILAICGCESRRVPQQKWQTFEDINDLIGLQITSPGVYYVYPNIDEEYCKNAQISVTYVTIGLTDPREATGYQKMGTGPMKDAELGADPIFVGASGIRITDAKGICAKGFWIAKEEGAARDPCIDVECDSDEECIDGECVPIDLCKDVICYGDGEFCKDGICVSIACKDASDCGTDGLMGATFCSENAIWDTYRTYFCEVPGTVDSRCLYDDEPRKIKDCASDEVCRKGKCLKKDSSEFGDCTTSECCKEKYDKLITDIDRMFEERTQKIKKEQIDCKDSCLSGIGLPLLPMCDTKEDIQIRCCENEVGCCYGACEQCTQPQYSKCLDCIETCDAAAQEDYMIADVTVMGKGFYNIKMAKDFVYDAYRKCTEDLN